MEYKTAPLVCSEWHAAAFISLHMALELKVKKVRGSYLDLFLLLASGEPLTVSLMEEASYCRSLCCRSKHDKKLPCLPVHLTSPFCSSLHRHLPLGAECFTFCLKVGSRLESAVKGCLSYLNLLWNTAVLPNHNRVSWLQSASALLATMW